MPLTLCRTVLLPTLIEWLDSWLRQLTTYCVFFFRFLICIRFYQPHVQLHSARYS